MIFGASGDLNAFHIIDSTQILVSFTKPLAERARIAWVSTGVGTGARATNGSTPRSRSSVTASTAITQYGPRQYATTCRSRGSSASRCSSSVLTATPSALSPATSSPGFSLMQEAVSYAIMSETPLVIVDVQRLGPSTGSATKGADGDIQFLQWGNSGGLPVIVLAPVDVKDCYELTVNAFNLAEPLTAIREAAGAAIEEFDKVVQLKAIAETAPRSGWAFAQVKPNDALPSRGRPPGPPPQPDLRPGYFPRRFERQRLPWRG